MPDFHYRALDASGASVEGNINAGGLAEAAVALKSRGLVPIAIKPVPVARRGRGGRKIGRQEIGHFTHQLAALLTAKLPLARALENLGRQASQETLRTLITDITRRVNEGMPLSDALAAYPQHFDDLYCSMVKAGETGGSLDAALLRLSEMQEKDAALRSHLKGALTYPLIMLVVMLMSIVVLVTFVVPRFTGIFADMGAALPWPTQLLISTSALFREWWWLLLGIIGAGVAAIRQSLRTPQGRMTWDRIKFDLPVVGSLVREIGVARFAITLGSLLGSGVPMLKALEATRDVSGNLVISEALGAVLREVREGRTLSAALADRPALFPPLVVGMTATGEETGNLPEMLGNVGKYFAQTSDGRIHTLTTLMEPAIILLMGLMVGFIIISMLLPIFEMTSLVK